MSASLRVTARSAFDPDDDTPVFVISVAAELAGMHAQTLRQYDRLGLVTPSRTRIQPFAAAAVNSYRRTCRPCSGRHTQHLPTGRR